MSYMERDSHEVALSRLLAWINGIDLPMFVVRKVSEKRIEYVHANAALGRAANMSTAHFPGNSASDLFSARTAAQLETNYRQCFDGEDTVSYEECILIDGRETWWETTLSKPIGFDGTVVLGVAHNITNRKTREFASAEAMAELNARFDELKLFSTMAAHDARSPLATVSSLLDLVLDEFNDMGDGKTELLGLCAKTVDEALTQITSTLERGRSIEAKTTVEDRIDMVRLCGDIAAMIDPEMQLTINLPKVVLACDEVVMQMCIRNLMSNAIRFCENRIDVNVYESATPGVLDIEVANDGGGLPAGTTVQDLTAEAEARGDGHGFGLKSIANLLSTHGGDFVLVDGPNRAGLSGACFRMTLPGRVIGESRQIAVAADRRETPRAVTKTQA